MIFDLRQDKPSIIKVIGVGGGGSNAVKHMFSEGILGVDFAICNTDNQALQDNDIPTKIQLGPAFSQGLGAGSMPEKGKQACLESIDEIRNYLENNCKILFLTAGMGGGTGTGAAPVIAKMAKEMEILTIAVVTLPFSSEGRKRVEQGKAGLEELKQYVDCVIVISNDKILEIHKDLTIRGGFAKADDVLLYASKSIAEIITRPGTINVDFQDVNTIMKDCGVAMMGMGVASGPNRAIDAVDNALNSPLLEDSSINGATKVLINITYGKDEPTMSELKSIFDFVEQEAAGVSTENIWGTCYDSSFEDELCVTIIATGLESANKTLNKEDIAKLTKTSNIASSKIVEDMLITKEPFIIDFGDKKEVTEENVMENQAVASFERDRLEIQKRKEMYKLERASISNTSNVYDLNIPAYQKNNISMQPDSSTSPIRNILDQQNGEIRPNNFLNRTVD
jgi:cell division protein FtsZ